MRANGTAAEGAAQRPADRGKRVMDAQHVAVATITWPRSAAEERVLARSLGLLAKSGIPVAVADRDTSPRFSRFLLQLPGFRVTLPQEVGLVAQVKASIALAATFERRFILYVEPDKELFFGRGLRSFLHRACDGDDVGVVVASRSEKSFRTFPATQRQTEAIANELCAELLDCSGDFFYGPFLMSRALLPHIATLDSRLGWGWRPSTFLAAHRQGLRVVRVTGEHPCPFDQREETDADRRHRINQLSQNILGLIG